MWIFWSYTSRDYDRARHSVKKWLVAIVHHWEQSCYIHTQIHILSLIFDSVFSQTGRGADPNASFGSQRWQILGLPPHHRLYPDVRYCSGGGDCHRRHWLGAGKLFPLYRRRAVLFYRVHALVLTDVRNVCVLYQLHLY